jgi:Flp pilus assembly protein TadG
VEFAIVAPVLLMLTFVTMDLARMFFRINNLSGAVREAARFAAARNTTTKTQIDSVVNAWTRPGVLDGLCQPPSSQQIAYTPGTTPNPRVVVQITGYTCDWLTPLPNWVGFGSSVPMAPLATFRWEWGP